MSDPLAVWIGNVPHATSRYAMQAALEDRGVYDVAHVKMWHRNAGFGGSCCIVRFVSRAAARLCIDVLDNCRPWEGQHQALEVKYATSRLATSNEPQPMKCPMPPPAPRPPVGPPPKAVLEKYHGALIEGGFGPSSSTSGGWSASLGGDGGSPCEAHAWANPKTWRWSVPGDGSYDGRGSSATGCESGGLEEECDTQVGEEAGASADVQCEELMLRNVRLLETTRSVHQELKKQAAGKQAAEAENAVLKRKLQQASTECAPWKRAKAERLAVQLHADIAAEEAVVQELVSRRDAMLDAARARGEEQGAPHRATVDPYM